MEDELPKGFRLDPQMEEIHKFSTYHRIFLEKSDKCYCFYCLKPPFSPKLIKEWIDNGKTALCPFCGIDAIIPEVIESKVDNPFTEDFIKKMYDYWFVDSDGEVYILKDGKMIKVPRNDIDAKNI